VGSKFKVRSFTNSFYVNTAIDLCEVLDLSDFDLDDFNMIDMNAKKVLKALSEFNKGEFVKGEEIHKKTGLTPDDISEAVKELEKSLLIEIPRGSQRLSPYDFHAVEITDFGRQVLEKYK
jgi:DNA-binding MarR family transcriptional regulator